MIDPVEIAAQIAPWCGPLPTAYLIAQRSAQAMRLPAWAAAAAGVAVELTGLAAIHTAISLSAYNADRKRDDPRAPAALAWAMPVVYIASTVALTVGLDAPAQSLAFVAMSAASFVILALRSGQRRRVAAARAAREERRERAREARTARRERREAAQLAQPAPQPAQRLAGRRADRADWRAVCAQLADNRTGCTANDVQMALVGAGYPPIPRRTAQEWARRIRTEGQNGYQENA